MKKPNYKYRYVANEDEQYAGWLLNKYGIKYYIFKVRDEILDETSYALQVPMYPAFTGTTLDELFANARKCIEVEEF